jgi:hypothetical protein
MCYNANHYFADMSEHGFSSEWEYGLDTGVCFHIRDMQRDMHMGNYAYGEWAGSAIIAGKGGRALGRHLHWRSPNNMCFSMGGVQEQVEAGANNICGL